MTRSRNRLHVTKLQDFTEFCSARGWAQQPIKGGYEVLRMRHPEHKDPLLVYRRDAVHLVHYTCHGEADRMLNAFLGHPKGTQASVDTHFSPTAEHAAEPLPWE